MFKLYPLSNEPDGFYIYGKTYGIKEYLKSVGAKWKNDEKHWVVTNEIIDKLKEDAKYFFTKMILVEVEAHCCESAQKIFVTEEDFKKGTVRMGCGMCDTRTVDGKEVKIIKPAIA